MFKPKDIFYNSTTLVRKLLSINYLINFSSIKIIFPFYHTVSDKELIHIKHLYKIIDCKRFEKDLDMLLKYYTPLDHRDLIDIINNKKVINKKCFFLSFDDGLSEIYHIVAPILVKKGIPATFFLNSNFVDNKDVFFRYKTSILIELISNDNSFKNIYFKWLKTNSFKSKSIMKNLLSISYNQRNLLDNLADSLGYKFENYLSEKKPYMSSFQIQELANQGFAIGSHSIDHPLFQDINLKEQLRQTKESSNFVKTNFKLNYSLFAFPFNDIGVTKSFFDYFYKDKKTLDLSFGTSGIKDDLRKNNLQRIDMEKPNSDAKNIIKHEYLYYALRKIL